MATRHDDRELGLHRRIPRRDFLNGMAIGITGAIEIIVTTAPDAAGTVIR